MVWSCLKTPLPRRVFVAHTLAGVIARSIAATANPEARCTVTGRCTAMQQQELALQVLGEVYGPWQQDWKPKGFERTAPRYLWTDAFGVCAYLSLFRATRDDRLLQQALALVEDVHNTLGHERPTAGATSPAWLRTADEDHPTRGGLRIGKPHPEGHPDGDGQYLHYLTKWAFALNQVAAATGDTKYLRWAVELMQTACRAFTIKTSSGVSRMVWKMSINLSHPVVNSMGNLDPYDGLVTCTLLQQAAAAAAAAGGSLGEEDAAVGPDQGAGLRVLEAEIAELEAMVDARYKSYTSDDPLDLGEALWLSHWQLGGGPNTQQEQEQQQQALQEGQQASTQEGQQQGGPRGPSKGSAWARHVSAVSLRSLDELWAAGYFEQPLRWRLAFREFGTSIGLQALLAAQPGTPDALLWKQRVQQIHDTWGQQLYTRDRDITPVMYATSLVPGVWL